jgi:hypothetical protein
MKQFKLLSADLFCKNVGTEEQLAQLKEEALFNWNQNQQSMTFSNEGCWRSQFQYKNIEWLIEEIRLLVNASIDYYLQLDPVYPNKVKNYGKPEIKYWTNVNEPGSKNSLHTHSLHHYVACYYIQSEDTGDLVFHNPSNITETCNPHSPFVSRLAFSPKEGDLLVWQGWMPHETEMNLSNKQRINIAFNIRFETPQMIYE